MDNQTSVLANVRRHGQALKRLVAGLAAEQNPNNIAPVVPVCELGAAIRSQFPDAVNAYLLADAGRGDDRVTIYQIGCVRVANTNGDPVWEEADPCEFAELLAFAGINPDEYNVVFPATRLYGNVYLDPDAIADPDDQQAIIDSVSVERGGAYVDDAALLTSPDMTCEQFAQAVRTYLDNADRLRDAAQSHYDTLRDDQHDVWADVGNGQFAEFCEQARLSGDIDEYARAYAQGTAEARDEADSERTALLEELEQAEPGKN
jgi:hypothetical protein